MNSVSNNYLSQEELVSNNIGLTYYCLHSFSIYANYPNYDDYVSAAQFGLVKAAKTFKPDKNIQFSTYAARCIKNEILMFMRKQKKQQNVQSLEEPIRFQRSSNDFNDISVLDTIADPNSDFIQKIEDTESFLLVLEICLNELSVLYQQIIYGWLSDLTQREISKKLSCSQSYVSRVLKKAFTTIKIKLYKEDKIRKEKHKISLAIQNNSYYEITIQIEKNNLKKDLYEFVSERLSESCSVAISKNGIIVQISLHNKPFLVLSDLVENLDFFHTHYDSTCV